MQIKNFATQHKLRVKRDFNFNGRTDRTPKLQCCQYSSTLLLYNLCQFKWIHIHKIFLRKTNQSYYFPIFMGRDSSVGIATACGLDGPGLNPGGDEIFRTCPDRTWGPPSLLYNGYRVFLGSKLRPGRDADPLPPSSAEVKNRVELYLYSP